MTKEKFAEIGYLDCKGKPPDEDKRDGDDDGSRLIM